MLTKQEAASALPYPKSLPSGISEASHQDCPLLTNCKEAPVPSKILTRASHRAMPLWGPS